MRKNLSVVLCCLSLLLCLPVCAQRVYEPFSEDASTRHARRMLKVFEALSEEKWDNAFEKLQDINENYEKMKQKHPDEAESFMDALRPLPELAQAMLEMAPEPEEMGRPAHDLWTAYERIKRIEKDSRYRRIDSYLSLIKDAPLRMSNIIDQLEDQLHDEVAAEHTVAAYDKLLLNLRRRSKIRETLMDECEDLTYESVKRGKSIEDCNAYLKRFAEYTTSTHKNDIIAHRDRLAYEATPATEQGMRQYLQAYPQSALVGEARQRLYEYAFKALQNSEDEYKAYLKEFPNSPLAQAARDSMASCAWRTAQDSATFAAYDRYCNTYPNSAHIAQANKQRILTGRNEFIRLGIPNIPDVLRGDSLIDNFLNSKRRSIYSMQAYGVHDARVDTIIEVTYKPKAEAYNKMYAFNVDGLIIREKHSQRGATDYVYEVVPGTGFYLQSKSPLGGKGLTYTPSFAPNGLLLQLTASDGSREVYEYESGDSVFVRSCYAKGATTPTLKERYVAGRLMDSVKANEHTVYEYNGQGDVERTLKYVGSKPPVQTTFEYDYDENGCWREQRQLNADGKLQIRKTRVYSNWAANP